MNGFSTEGEDEADARRTQPISNVDARAAVPSYLSDHTVFMPTGNTNSASVVSGSADLPNNISSVQICCLVDDGARCGKLAGNAAYSKRVQKTVAQRRLRLNIDHNARHIYICDYHKDKIQSVRTKKSAAATGGRGSGARAQHNANSDDEIVPPARMGGQYHSRYERYQHHDGPDVDLNQLQVNTLRKYKRFYKVQTRPGINKVQLADTLMRHFRTIPVDEKEALTYFIYMVKSNRTKQDGGKAGPPYHGTDNSPERGGALLSSPSRGHSMEGGPSHYPSGSGGHY